MLRDGLSDLGYFKTHPPFVGQWYLGDEQHVYWAKHSFLVAVYVCGPRREGRVLET